ncbi:MAG: M48 family peptidase [Dehalococcoidia bacterium]|nr:MAG: M48 family peptidase [Dehalococcoidia bacterium]
MTANSSTVEIDGVGPVLFERSKRARRLSVSVKRLTGVRVAIPYGVSFKKAEEFVRARTDWINKHLDRIEQFEREYTSITQNSPDIDMARAKRKLSRRLKHLAEKHGFTYNRVFIRNQRTRWGSCSSRRNISLNMRLVMIPDELMDYVILHELTHTRFKNHSKDFYAELDRLVGNRKGMDVQLKEYGLGLL